MKLFTVKENTQVSVIKDGKEWYGHNFQKHITTKDNYFELEEMAIDPTTSAPSFCNTRYNTHTVGGDYARKGFYGFRRDGWVVLVHMSQVEVI